MEESPEFFDELRSDGFRVFHSKGPFFVIVPSDVSLDEEIIILMWNILDKHNAPFIGKTWRNPSEEEALAFRNDLKIVWGKIPKID